MTISHLRRFMRILPAALLIASGMPGMAQSTLAGDARTACEAILCLATSQQPHECTPSIKKLMSMKAWKRPSFLKKCPSVSDQHVQNAYQATLLQPEEASVKIGASKKVDQVVYIDIQSLTCAAAAIRPEWGSRFDAPTPEQLAIPDGYTAWDGNLLAMSGYSNFRQMRYGYEFHAYAYRERIRKVSLSTGKDVEVGPWSIWHTPPGGYDGSEGWAKNLCNLNLNQKWSPILTGDSM